jgi:hypothetical protein
VRGWVTVVVLATGVAAYAAAVLLIPGFGPPFVAEVRTHLPVALSMHLAGGVLALATGAWQLNTRIRSRHVGVHRGLGRLYVGAVIVGGVGGLMLAPGSQAGIVTHLGFGSLAIAWLGTTTAGYLAIRRQDQATHRRWMLRSYAITFAAVTLRIYLPLSQVLGLPFEPSYQVISWLCWVPNLLVVELLVVRRAHVVPVAIAS